MSASQPEGPPLNALSVLLSALPSDVASSIEAGFSSFTQELFTTQEGSITNPTILPTLSPQTNPVIISTSSSEQSEQPTSIFTVQPATELSSSHPTSRPTSQPTAFHTSHPTSRPSSHPTLRSTSPSSTNQPTTLATLPSTTSTKSQTTTSTSSTSSTPSSTLTANASEQPSITPQKQQANGTVAGIATGSVAGVVLLTLALFFFLRRRQRKRALQAVEEKASQPYPEVAWLYDPRRSPPRSHSPAPQAGDAGAGGAAHGTRAVTRRSSLLAPEVVLPEGEPLLAPERVATRESNPVAGGGRRSASPGGVAVR